MKPDELIELIKLLKECNVSRFKQGDIEINFEHDQAPVKAQRTDLKPVSLEIPPAIPETEPPHIVQEMKSLFKTSDEELIERMFPLPKEDEAPV